MDLIIENALTFLDGRFQKRNLSVKNGVIERISDCADMDDSCHGRIKADNLYLLPGFVDIHTHGGIGYSFMDVSGEPAKMDELRRFYASQGTTSFLPTTLTAPLNATFNVLKNISTYAGTQQNRIIGADIVGINAEGPFISHAYKGAQNPNFLIPATKASIDQMIRSAGGLLKVITVAPETENVLKLIRYMVDQGITVSVGHTAATYDVVKQAFSEGATQLTHFCNGMSPFHHRKPGAVGAGLMIDSAILEIICDGLHVHPDLIDFLFKLKTPDRICCITDSVTPAGCPDGDYYSGGLQVVKKGHKITLTGTDILAGSCLTLADAFDNARHFVHQKVEDIIPAFTINPARQAKIDKSKGSIQTGKDADFLLMNQDFKLQATFVRGQKVFAD